MLILAIYVKVIRTGSKVVPYYDSLQKLVLLKHKALHVE
jgi:hypothetical protein